MQFPLPNSWVNSLFARLAVRYGSAWAAKWEGLDMDAVRADWADELAGYVNCPDAIKHALDHLPHDRPPNVLQFRALCIRRPETLLPALPAPDATPADKERVRNMLAGLKHKLTQSPEG